MKTCLIVDESNVIRKVAGRILFQLGLEVQNAGTAAEAAAKFDGGELPDLILVALTLPDMPGEELVRGIRARPDGAGTVILGLLVESNLGQMTRLKRAGANGFIYKPFDRAALTSWIQPYLGRAAA